MASSRQDHDGADSTGSGAGGGNGLRAGRDWRSVLVFLGVAAAVVAADLWMKDWSFRHVAGEPVVLTRGRVADEEFWRRHWHEPVGVVERVLSLRLTTNTGAVFGMGKGSQWLFIVVSVGAAGVIGRVFCMSRRGDFLMHAGLGLICGGALGNLYDRVVFNQVRDMLWLFPGVKLPWGMTWPGGSDDVYPWLFNVADAGLVVGVVLLMAAMMRGAGGKSTEVVSGRVRSLSRV